MLDRLNVALVFLLPLLVWPGIEQPFSTPKLGLLCAWMLILVVASIWHAETLFGRLSTIQWGGLLGWIAVVSISSLVRQEPSLRVMLVLTLPPAAAVTTIALAKVPERMVRALAWSSLALALVAVCQGIGFDPFRVFGWMPDATGASRMRVYGTVGNPNFVAAFLGCAIPVWIGRSWDVARNRRAAFGGNQRKRTRPGGPAPEAASSEARDPARPGTKIPLEKHDFASLLPGATAAFLLIAIAVTGSRAAAFGLGMAGLSCVAIRGRRALLLALVVVLVAGGLVLISPARPLSTTISGRLYVSKIAASQLKNLPLLGFGPGAFALMYPSWEVAEWNGTALPSADRRFSGVQDHAHNDYLQILLETGPVGSLSFLLLIGSFLVPAFQNRHAFPALLGAMVLLVIALVDFPFYRPAGSFAFWLLLAYAGTSHKVPGEDAALEKSVASSAGKTEAKRA